MRKTRVIGLVVTMLAMAALPPSQADVPEFEPKITDVTVFKDGHSLVMARGAVNLEDGWCRTREVPAPILGAFWTFVMDKESQVDFVKAGVAEAEETRPCLTFEEMIQANVGKRAIIVEQPKDAGAVSHEGVLLGILEHEAERETETVTTLPERWDRWQANIPSQPVRQMKAEEVKSLASFVMLQKEIGVQMIKREDIRSICLADGKPATEHKQKKMIREISVHVLRDGKPLVGEAEVGMIYIQKGIRWIPDYRVELLANGKAKVSLQGSIINELADFEDADLRLVVGVPSFVMKDYLSPMALREIGLSLSSYFVPAGRGRAETRDYLSNAIMSQVARADRSEGAPAEGGPEIAGEGQQEDLFVYHKPGITLRKGERAVVKLLEVTVAYEDIYTWDVAPVPPKELWRHMSADQVRQLANALAAAKAMHEIRLTNTGNVPWTTGPATIFKEGMPLGQHVLTYTSLKNKVDVPVTIATDLNTKKEEAEVGRTPNILISGNSYTKVACHGKLTVINFKDRPIRLYVTRKVIGSATEATADGKILLSNVMEDTSVEQEGNPWHWWSWPWWYYSVNSLSKITWETVISAGKSATFEYDWYYYCN